MPRSAFAVVALLTLLPHSASANLLRTRNKSATVSSLSNQLLAQPASAAGRYRNVWDADPPAPAVTGFHYFLYNMDAAGNPLGDGNESLTARAIAAGPGYTIDSAEVLIKAKGPGQSAFFTNLPVTQTNDLGNAGADYTTYYELGLIRVQFTLTNVSAAGQIAGSSDSAEDAYAGDLVNGERGVEHFRLFTDTRDGHGEDTRRGVMTAYVPDGFVPGVSNLPVGYLDFGDNDRAIGMNVKPAAINTVLTPEPTLLVSAGLGLAALRRPRRR